MLPSNTNQHIIHNSTSYNYSTEEPSLKENKKAFDPIREPNFLLVRYTAMNLTFRADYNRVVVSATKVDELAPTEYLAKLIPPPGCEDNYYVLKREDYVKSFAKFKRASYAYTLKSATDSEDIETDSEDIEDETTYLHPGKMVVKKGPSTLYEEEFFPDGTGYTDVFDKNYEHASYCLLFIDKPKGSNLKARA